MIRKETMMLTTMVEIHTAHRPEAGMPTLVPPCNSRCRHCVIRNGVPCCGLLHDIWRCNWRCPYAEYAPIRFPGQQKYRISYGV